MRSSIISFRPASRDDTVSRASSAIRWAKSPSPRTRTTASRPPARSRTSPSAGCGRTPQLVTATVLVKKCAAEANRALGRLPADVADAIVAAADEVLAGAAPRSVRRRRLSGRRRHVAQHERERGARQPRRGAARRAARQLHARAPQRSRQHGPVAPTTCIPTATRLALLTATAGAGRRGARRWPPRSTRRPRRSPTCSRSGRTHLQDAVPITLGQEFGGYAACDRARRRRRRDARARSCSS